MKGKRVLITGGTGSFGGSAVPRFLAADAAEVIVYSRDEYKQFVMRQGFPGEPRLKLVLGDVRDREHLEHACRGVNYLIHAAAMKQVPSCEENVDEAIKTNILGTANAVEAAISGGVDCAINLSADKALYPTSVYGVTKLLLERLFTEGNRRSSVRFVNLRYNNVMASRGSVFEVFRERLSKGETITVFDPRMKRFFLTQKEIVDLCTFAFENSVGGETYMKESRPVSIVELAQAMIEVIGQGELVVKQHDGRQGEKLDAVLLSQEESSRTVRYGDLFIVNGLGRELRAEPTTAIQQRDCVLDDYEPMERARLVNMIREELASYQTVASKADPR